jgi:hypothetical protein
MESLFWHLANRTAETQFIFNLFHLLLAGLTLLVLLHQLRTNRGVTAPDSHRLLALGFFLLVLHFAFLTLYFGAEFFFQTELEWAGFEIFSHGLMACGLLIVVAAYWESGPHSESRVARWILRSCALVGVWVLANIAFTSPQLVSDDTPHSVALLAMDSLALLGVGLGMRVVLRGADEGRTASLVALASFGLAFLVHAGPLF